MSKAMNGRFGMLAVAAELANPPGPDGAPINPNWYFTTKWHFRWTNYDSSYYTDLSKDNGTTVYTTLGPGVTEYGSEYSQQSSWVVRHSQGGLYSEWAGIL